MKADIPLIDQDIRITATIQHEMALPCFNQKKMESVFLIIYKRPPKQRKMTLPFKITAPTLYGNRQLTLPVNQYKKYRYISYYTHTQLDVQYE